MRQIGTVESQQQAEKISAFLMTREISTQCEADGDVWQVWVKEEDQLDQARELLAEFQANPDDAKYREAIDVAQKIAREKDKKLQEARSNYVQMTSDRWNAPITKVAPFTVATIAIAVVVSLFLTGLGEDRDSAAFRSLAFGSISTEEAIEIQQAQSGDDPLQVENGASYDNRLRFASLAKGEVWRMITPIFIHFGIFHLLFNMYWLAFFGKQIEYRTSSIRLALLIAVIAIASNVAQCVVPQEWSGAAIAGYGTHWTIALGGMSGVVYGLFGFVWMKMTFEPRSGYYISMISVAILLIWLVACMSPDFFIPNVANWAHGIGLITGMIIGYFPKLLSDLGIRPADKK